MELSALPLAVISADASMFGPTEAEKNDTPESAEKKIINKIKYRDVLTSPLS